MAFPINDIKIARDFYTRKLGFQVGRSSEKAIIFNFFEHQIIGHMSCDDENQKSIYPRHFGIIFKTLDEYNKIKKQVKIANIDFCIKPKVRFVDEITEHHTFFIKDPFNNFIEFKYYCHSKAIFENVSGNIGDI